MFELKKCSSSKNVPRTFFLRHAVVIIFITEGTATHHDDDDNVATMASVFFLKNFTFVLSSPGSSILAKSL